MLQDVPIPLDPIELKVRHVTLEHAAAGGSFAGKSQHSGQTIAKFGFLSADKLAAIVPVSPIPLGHGRISLVSLLLGLEPVDVKNIDALLSFVGVWLCLLRLHVVSFADLAADPFGQGTVFVEITHFYGN